MSKLRFLIIIFLLLTSITFLTGCIAELALEDVAALSEDTEAGGGIGALNITREGVVIANDLTLNDLLDKVYIDGDELYIKTPGGGTKTFGQIISSNEVSIEKYPNIVQLLGEIYKVTSDEVRVRSSAMISDYNVLKSRNTGQLVLKLSGNNSGWAYVEAGNNIYGWMSLSCMALASPNKSHSNLQYQFIHCRKCNGKGHLIQNTLCTMCSGTGEINCLYCNGQGKTMCYHCGGTGYLPCYNCGSGTKRICTYCNGKGSITCNYCRGTGKQACYQCLGKGELAEDKLCDQCNGTGWIRILK